VIAAGLVGLAAAAPAHAQSLGRVQGTVVDRAGQGLEKVEIVLTSEKTKARLLRGKSKKDGKFVFPFVETGPYILQVNLAGYKVLKVAVDSRDESGEESVKKELVLSPKDAIPTVDVPFTGNFGHCTIDLIVVKEEEFVDAYRELKKGTGEAAKTAEAPLPGGAAGAAAPGEAPKDPYDAGRQLAEASKHAEAVQMFDQGLAVTPDDANLLYGKGRSQLELGNYSQAETTLQKLVLANPGFANAHYYLGKAQAADYKNAAAVQSYRQEIELSPDKKAFLLLKIAELQHEMSKTQPAALDQERATLEELLAVEPTNAQAISQLAEAYRLKGDKVKQAEMYRRLTEADPAHADLAFYNLGVQALNANRREEAATNFQKALDINPKHAGAHLQLGYCLFGMGKTPEAVAHFQEYLTLEPDGKDAPEVKHLIAAQKR
jgi:tetratricopeptide (TPR) repeat protein